MKDTSQKYSSEVIELIEKFGLLQQDRVKTYRTFDEGHKDYLNSAPEYDFLAYRQVVHNVTQEFKRISDKIIAVVANLKEHKENDLADIISLVQDCEAKKLNVTCEHQLAKQTVIEFEDSVMAKEKERELLQQLGSIIEEINDNLSELRCLVYDL